MSTLALCDSEDKLDPYLLCVCIRVLSMFVEKIESAARTLYNSSPSALPHRRLRVISDAIKLKAQSLNPLLFQKPKNKYISRRMCVSSNPRFKSNGVLFDSAGRFQATPLLRTTCMRSQQFEGASSMSAIQTNKQNRRLGK